MQNNNRGGFNAEYSNIRGQTGYPVRNSGGQTVPNTAARSDPRRSSGAQSSGYAQTSRTQRVEPISTRPNPDSRQRQGSLSSAPQRRGRPKPRKRRGFLHDFLLGFAIGLAIFGTAAIFVVRAIIEILL